MHCFLKVFRCQGDPKWQSVVTKSPKRGYKRLGELSLLKDAFARSLNLHQGLRMSQHLLVGLGYDQLIGWDAVLSGHFGSTL